MDPIVKRENRDGVPVYTVRPILTDEEAEACLGTFLTDKHFPFVLDHDADVYTEDGKMLARFRKGVLDDNKLEDAYEAMKGFITRTSSDRGVASGSEKGVGTGHKHKVMSNIMGFFDKWGVSQKSTFKRSGIRSPGPCRLCSFNAKYPEHWERIQPLIRDIDAQYKALCPEEHAGQRKAAKSTPFHIRGTAFSTITTNLNFRTAAHKDSGDWAEGVGNLVVIERGAPYKGAFTGLPKYGVAVDCRHGDFLAMDVHQVHGNSPMVPTDETSMRVSLVSYLREGIVKKCGNQSMYDPVALERKIDRWRKTLKAKK
jgi:hypothetical protein